MADDVARLGSKAEEDESLLTKEGVDPKRQPTQSSAL